MEIVISDTNILIDLFNSGLLVYCKNLSIDFRTLDVVINEIELGDQYEAIMSIVDDGFLQVCELSGEQIQKVLETIGAYHGVCNLSPEDISVMIYAKENNCRLLTGDKALRKKAEQDGIIVSGVLYLTDMMINRGIITNSDMRTALQKLLDSNARLPKKLIRERIERL